MNTQNVITEIRSHPTAQFTVKRHTLRGKKRTSYLLQTLKWSMVTKSGKKGRMSSILSRLQLDRQFMAFLTSSSFCTTCLAIFSQSFFLNSSSSSGRSAQDLAKSTSTCGQLKKRQKTVQQLKSPTAVYNFDNLEKRKKVTQHFNYLHMFTTSLQALLIH